MVGWYEDSRAARPCTTHRSMSTHVGYYVFCQSQVGLVRKHQGKPDPAQHDTKELTHVLIVLPVTWWAGPGNTRAARPCTTRHERVNTHISVFFPGHVVGWYEDSRAARPCTTHRSMSTHVGYYVFCQSQAWSGTETP